MPSRAREKTAEPPTLAGNIPETSEYFRPIPGPVPKSWGFAPAARGMWLALLEGMSDRVVMCAVDLGPMTGRVLFHAGALARMLDASLIVVHVNGGESPAARQRVLEICLRATPYEVPLDEHAIILRAGRVSEMIQREARRLNPLLLVTGSRGRSGMARLLLGSTSEALLKEAPVPLLLIPPTDVDIVSMGDRPLLTCGPVLAAIDLSLHCEAQLTMAGRMASLAHRPLLLLTVARSRLSDRAAAGALQQRADASEVNPRALIVRRGGVAQEIAHCALAEDAGLVVMGIDHRPGRQPGAIATAVLKTGHAFVLAVPGCEEEVRHEHRIVDVWVADAGRRSADAGRDPGDCGVPARSG